MHTFSSTSKPTQKATSGSFRKPRRALMEQSHNLGSALRFQRSSRQTSATDLTSQRFAHDFSRIPVYQKGEQLTSSRGAHVSLGKGETIAPATIKKDGLNPIGRAEFPVDFVGPLQPGDTSAVPYDFVGPLEQGVTRSSSFHPTMTVVTPGRATSQCGGFEHKVRWGVPAAANQTRGWVVQKVDIQCDVKDCNNRSVTPHPIDNPANYPFWEAWEFTRGGNVWVGPASAGTKHSGDTFSGSDYGAGTKGRISLIGEVKGIVGYTLPSGMTVRNTFPAWSLPYTRTQPTQFGSTLPGASHVVTSQWNCCPSGTVTQGTRVTATP